MSKNRIPKIFSGKDRILNLKYDDALLQAIIKGEVDLVKSLCQDSELVNLHNKDDGKTPLCLAAEKGDVEIMNILIRAGANIEATDHIKFTPLALAVQERNEKAVEVLLSAGANVNAFKDDAGDAILHRAMECFHSGIFLNLMKHGARIEVNNNGFAPGNRYFGVDLLNLFEEYDKIFTKSTNREDLTKLNSLVKNANYMVTSEPNKQIELGDAIKDALVSRGKLALSNNTQAHKILLDNLEKCDFEKSERSSELKQLKESFDIANLLHNDENSTHDDQISYSGELAIPHSDF